MLGLFKQGERGDSKARDGGGVSSGAKVPPRPIHPPTCTLPTTNNTDNFEFSPLFKRPKFSALKFSCLRYGGGLGARANVPACPIYLPTYVARCQQPTTANFEFSTLFQRSKAGLTANLHKTIHLHFPIKRLNSEAEYTKPNR